MGKSSIILLITAVLILILAGWWFLTPDSTEVRQTEMLRGLESLSVPEGFEVELVAGPDLISYPMFATFDDRGRLYISESTGPNTMTTDEMLEDPSYRIRIIEDTDGDGIFDKTGVFADNIPLPQGGSFWNGSFYVAAAPDLLRLKDTDGDDVADEREVILTGWTLSVNGATLHGPFLGPDGWLYLTDARRSYSIRTLEGELLEGKGGRIWRCRPDGTGLEWVVAGGFDNPVELIFTPAGETIGTMTYFINPQAGQRDALMHWVEGGVYPKPHSVIQEDQLKRTGELMPVMTKFARVAPSGIARYRSQLFGEDFQENLFSVQFNTHRVLRHILTRQGATFTTRDEDFVTSADPDFHPTDVLEDADGSLLVLDTGGWFIKGCPLSRIPKPEFKGGIYRIRKKGAPEVEDPRGKELALAEMEPEELASYLEDPRPAVRDRVVELLVSSGSAAVPALVDVLENGRKPETKALAVFGLSRIGGTEAQKAVRSALDQPHFEVRIAAARVLGLAGDTQAVPRLREMVVEDEAPVRRQAATALGQIGDRSAVASLIEASARPEDRFLEHAVIHSLIVLRDSDSLRKALQNSSPEVRKAALIALDQMEGSPIQLNHLLTALGTEDRKLRQAALWVASHHPEWAGDISRELKAGLQEAELEGPEGEGLRELLVSLCSQDQIQQMTASLLADQQTSEQRQVFLLGALQECSLEEFPESWEKNLRQKLVSDNEEVQAAAVSLIRSHSLPGFEEGLTTVAANDSLSPGLRTEALDALIASRPKLSQDQFDFLYAQLQPGVDAPVRQLAAATLGQARLNEEQLLQLARDYLPRADPLLLTRLLDAFKKSSDPEVGEAVVTALMQSSHGLDSFAEDALRDVFANYPERVRQKAQPLIERLREMRESRVAQLHQMESELQGGDLARGRKIFFGNEVGCSSCHTIGLEGGRVGPDLTSVGAIRSRHDLLEAIMFPSASFVREYESYRLKTDEGVYSGIVREQTPETVVLVTGADSRMRFPRSSILSMDPSSVSIMPEGLDESLTAQEMADLLAYLEAQKTRPADSENNR